MDSQGPTARPHGGGREDCWSEVATDALIESWGDRFLQLNRGNLRQKDWKEIADAVNGQIVGGGGGGGGGGSKPYKTDVQCKNRIDTLKKKYKLEKTKPSPSSWRFFPRLDFLIGAAANTKKPAAANAKANAVTLTIKSGETKPTSRPGPRPAARNRSPESSIGDEDDDDDDDDGADVARKHRMEAVELSDGAACRELARAILKFGEIYERIESSNQKMMMELERQRMEFAKDLEFQRLNMFMDAQLELEKRKRPKYAPGSGKVFAIGTRFPICDF